MVINTMNYLSHIASLLNVKLDSTKVNNVPNSGVTSTIFKLLKKANSSLGPKNQLESVEIQQWIEYIIVYVTHVDSTQNAKTVLKELNDVLPLKTYLISQRLTIVDILLYHVLLKALDGLSNIEKEKYLHVCRYFDNLQQEEKLRKKNKMVDFSSNFLATLVPARH